MKYAVLKYADNSDEIQINSIIKKMPKAVVDFYIQKVNPYKCKDINALGAEGYEITLPLLLAEAEENYEKNEGIIKKTIEVFRDKGVDIIIPPNGGVFPNIMRKADGHIIFAFFIMPAITKALKSLGMDIKTASVLIIDGGNVITNLVLDNIYSQVNFLSIYTDRVQNFDDKIEEIYDETGLNVQVFSNNKNSILKEADIIINAGMDLENYDYYFKRCSIYMDIAGNKQKLRRIMAKRHDMLFIDSIEIKKDDGFYKADVFEAVEYVNNIDFRKFLTSQYNKMKQEELLKHFNSLETTVTVFYCNGKIVKQDRFSEILKLQK